MIAALVRLAIAGSAVYLGVQFARWEPGLAFPLGVVAVAGVVVWLVRAYQAQLAAQAAQSDAEDKAVEADLGPHMAAIAVEEHHDRWEAQR